MNSEEKQLKGLNVDKFRIVTVDNNVWLELSDEDSYGGSYDCGEDFNALNDLGGWLADWNVEQLVDLELSPSASFTSKKLNVKEKEIFETYRAKLLRCKQYALNYYENSLFGKKDDKE